MVDALTLLLHPKVAERVEGATGLLGDVERLLPAAAGLGDALAGLFPVRDGADSEITAE